MSKLIFPFVGIFGQDPSLFKRVCNIMEKRFDPIADCSKLFDFIHTNYYAEEMGENLKKMFFVFKRPISPERLVDIKLYTMRLESKFSINGKRTVNLDPGYLSLNKVVLATHKDYSHRLYIGKGIYGELTLYFKNKTYNPFPWTYPDYRTTDYIIFFNDIRKLCYNK